MRTEDRLIIALDLPSMEEAEALVGSIPRASHFKVGLELYLASAGKAVSKLKQMGKEVFLDLKFHDIPQTVAGAVGQAVRSGADMMDVHASGGAAMLEAAVKARDLAAGGGRKPSLIAITILTSLDNEDIRRIGFSDDTATAAAIRLASLAKECGMDGAVCSPLEIRSIRERLGPVFRLVTPGVRPQWSEKGDQKRVFTPFDAMAAGSDYIVVGRPIVKADDPKAAYDRVIDEMEAGLR